MTEYFQANLRRMDCPTYTANGRPLGSAIVEPAGRRICGLRCKQPGMRWSLRAAQKVPALRALALSASSRWFAFLAGHPQTRRPRVASLTLSQTLEAPA